MAGAWSPHDDGPGPIRRADATEALALAVDLRPDLIVTDALMPRTSGLELIPRLQSRLGNVRVPTIVVSGTSDISTRRDAFERGAGRTGSARRSASHCSGSGRRARSPRPASAPTRRADRATSCSRTSATSCARRCTRSSATPSCLLRGGATAGTSDVAIERFRQVARCLVIGAAQSMRDGQVVVGAIVDPDGTELRVRLSSTQLIGPDGLVLPIAEALVQHSDAISVQASDDATTTDVVVRFAAVAG